MRKRTARGGPALKTLDRALSRAGLGSRNEARRWIAEKRVRVNGKPVRTADCWVDPERDRITVDGKPVRSKKRFYFLLHKPKGYVTTYKDPEGRPTVYDLITAIEEWVFPVGRLDRDTSGLLVMTNDSGFAERLTNPEYKAPKTYVVKTSTRLSEDQLDQLRHGVVLNDGPTRPAAVTKLRDAGPHTLIEITITEGRNRQVRRMIRAVGSRVVRLARTAIGEVRLGGLEPGAYRPLTPAEIRALGGAGKA